MKNDTKSDNDLLEEVALAFATADAKGENWVDHLPSELSDDGTWDPYYVGTLDDGRQVTYTPWNSLSPYSISKKETP